MPRTYDVRVPDSVLIEAYQRLGTKAAVAREVGMARSAVVSRLQKATAPSGGRSGLRETKPRELPPEGAVSRYIITCAQNNTEVEKPVWRNLMALAAHYGAEVMVSRFSYNKAAYGDKSVKPGRGPTDDDVADLWYAPEIAPYVCDDRVQIAPGLVFCGEMNILPTAVDPLSGLETYTERHSGIFPHPKIAMRSIASTVKGKVKFNYTTGTVTQRNYIQKKAGLKAEFHHCYGALLVEVDSDGSWWCRQLNADRDGTIYDLFVRAKNGRVSGGHGVEAITWGDVHPTFEDEDLSIALWGDEDESMLDVLRPKYQFLHDLVDVRATNYRKWRDPHFNFQRYLARGEMSVECDLSSTSAFLHRLNRPWCHTYVVASNHDEWLERWLREGDYRQDPENAVLFLELQLAYYKAMERGDGRFPIAAYALRKYGCPEDIMFLSQDESCVILGVECGMHGHLGVDGARGTPSGLAKMGRRATIGHLHRAGIFDGLYVAGIASALDHDYNRGPSTWSWSQVVLYPNGKRAIITCWNGKWRA